MKKFQKSVLSGFAAIAMLVGPQAVFADEAVINANQPVAQDVQGLNGSIKPMGLIYGTVGDPTQLLYLSTPVTVTVNAPNGGNFVVYAISDTGSYNYMGEIIGSKSLTFSRMGYYKIYVSSSFTGTFIVNY